MFSNLLYALPGSFLDRVHSVTEPVELCGMINFPPSTISEIAQTIRWPDDTANHWRILLLASSRCLGANG